MQARNRCDTLRAAPPTHTAEMNKLLITWTISVFVYFCIRNAKRSKFHAKNERISFFMCVCVCSAPLKSLLICSVQCSYCIYLHSHRSECNAWVHSLLRSIWFCLMQFGGVFDLVDSVWFCSVLLRSVLCCSWSVHAIDEFKKLNGIDATLCTSKAEQPAAVYPHRALIRFDYYFKQESKSNSTNIKYRMPVAVIAANKMNAEKLLYHGIPAYIYIHIKPG